MGNRALLFWPLAAWTVFAALALWLTRGTLSLDTDSAMRLVQVRDLMAGQGWFDTVQHRMNTPFGLPMHWSRLVDGPLAALALVSERFALTAWPLLLLAGLLFLLARLADRLGGPRAVFPVLILALLCPELYAAFTPGNIDHHGLQLVLMLAALLGVVEQRPRLTAVTVALSLGVGLESLPYALIAIGFSLIDRQKAKEFGLTLAAASLLLLVATTADPYRTVPVCDTYSLFYAVLLAAGGLGAAAISQLPRHRLWVLALLVVALLGVAALLNPVCFAGPYGGLDARMKTIFLARINEARPVWDFFRLSPSQTIGGYGYAAAAVVLSFFAPSSRARTIALAFAAVAIVVATLQYRATPFALVFALPGLAAGLVQLTRQRSRLLLAAALVAGNGAAFTLAAAFVEGLDKVSARASTFGHQVACGREDAMAPLRLLPKGRVAAFVDQGPAILAYTPHSAVAGPYHRDAAGILDSYEIFAGKNPRAVLERRRIDYVMACRGAPDWEFYRQQGGLVSELAAGQRPSWLVPVQNIPAGPDIDVGETELYRVKR